MKISIGRYIPSDSIVHSMDPRQKIVSTLIIVISILLCENLFEYVIPITLIALMIIESGISFSNYLKGLKGIAFIIVFAVVVQLLSYGVVDAIYIFFRLFLILLAGEVLSFTTSPTSISHAMEDIARIFGFSKKSSRELSMVMSIALRFAPILIDEAERIAKAQISRGAPLDSKKITDRMKALVSIVVPLMSSSVRKAEELAIAMKVRGFDPSKERTRYVELRWSAIDSVQLIFSIFAFILVVL